MFQMRGKGEKKMILYKLKVLIISTLADIWYWLMTPLALYYSKERINKRYEKKRSKITEEQAIKWIAEDIARYLIQNKKSSIDILICEYANDDHFCSECDLTGAAPYFIKRKKTKMAFYKFNRTLEFQEKIINKLKSMKTIKVTQKVEDFSSWKRIDNYKKAITVRYNS